MSTVRYSFHVKRAAAGAPKRLQAGKAKPVSEKVPRIARLLALAHKFQGMLERGEVESMADLARLGRVSRAPRGESVATVSTNAWAPVPQ